MLQFGIVGTMGDERCIIWDLTQFNGRFQGCAEASVGGEIRKFVPAFSFVHKEIVSPEENLKGAISYCFGSEKIHHTLKSVDEVLRYTFSSGELTKASLLHVYRYFTRAI